MFVAGSRGLGLSAQEYGEFGFFLEMTSGLCFRFQHNARLNSWHMYVRSNGVAWLSCSFGRRTCMLTLCGRHLRWKLGRRTGHGCERRRRRSCFLRPLPVPTGHLAPPGYVPKHIFHRLLGNSWWTRFRVNHEVDRKWHVGQRRRLNISS